MLRLLAVIAFIIGIILFVVVAIGSPTDGATLNEWGFVAVAAGLACFALEGVSLPRTPAP